MKYCTECGKELIEIQAKGFDENTGKRNTILVCPTRLCDHTGNSCEFVSTGKFWDWILGTQQCTKCGIKLCWD